MDDPTKDLIPRSSIKYYLRKETVSTNPDEYEAHEKFIAYMDDPEISQFGRWMLSNGINTALTAIDVDLDKIPSTQPERKSGRWFDAQYPFSKCSICGCYYDTANNIGNFCPYCGAKMEEQYG